MAIKIPGTTPDLITTNSSEELTSKEMNGWWRHRGDEFNLYKIQKMTWVGSPEVRPGVGVITRNTMYITIANLLSPMSLAVFKQHFELVETMKDHTLDNEIKVAMLAIANIPTEWEQLNVDQTCKAMDLVRYFWDRNVAELNDMLAEKTIGDKHET